MIFKTTNSAVRLDGMRSILLVDNEIYASSERINYKLLLSLASPEHAQHVFREMLAVMATDGIFYADENAFCYVNPIAERHMNGCSYVCRDGMIVRIDDLDSISIDAQDPCVVRLSFPDGGKSCFDFVSAEAAAIAFDALVGHINTPGVLSLVRSGDELMVHQNN